MAWRKEAAAPLGAAGVPHELLDVDDDAWTSDDAALDWADRHDLVLRPLAHRPRSRHRAAVEAWARRAGLTRSYTDEARSQLLDLKRLKAAGIPLLSTVRDRLAQIEARG